MASLATFPGIEECIRCYGRTRVAKRQEFEGYLRGVSPEFRAAVESQDGTWYVCPRCGPESAVKWMSIGFE